MFLSLAHWVDHFHRYVVVTTVRMLMIVQQRRLLFFFTLKLQHNVYSCTERSGGGGGVGRAVYLVWRLGPQLLPNCAHTKGNNKCARLQVFKGPRRAQQRPMHSTKSACPCVCARRRSCHKRNRSADTITNETEPPHTTVQITLGDPSLPHPHKLLFFHEFTIFGEC